MGAYQSKLTSEEVSELQNSTSFSSAQIEYLYHRFKKLDRSRKGHITSEDLYLIPEFAMNPLIDRLISCFDADRTELITFDRFVHVIDQSINQKVELLMKICDIDGDQSISPGDLCNVLKLLVGDNISDEVCMEIVQYSFNQSVDPSHESFNSNNQCIKADDLKRILGDHLDSFIIRIPELEF